MKLTRLVLAVAVLTAIGLGGWKLYRDLTRPTVHPVRVVPLERARLQSTLSATGFLSSPDVLELTAPVSSMVSALPVSLGDTVETDAPLVEFDQRDVDDRLRVADATRREAQEALNRSSRTLRSLRPVVAAGGEPEQALRDARSRVRQDRARLDAETARVTALRGERKQYQVVSPVNGVVVRLDARPGQYVTVGKPVLSIVPTDDLMIRARIDQSASASLSSGDRINVSSESLPDKVLPLTIHSIDPAVEREGSSSYVIAWIRYNADNPLRLRLNQQVDLDVVVDARDDALAMPLEGLVTRGEEEFVRIIRNGRIALLPVSTGIQDGRLIEISSGLDGNEQIVVPTGNNVRSGSRVRIVETVKTPSANNR
jgi:RND family efflux transporter MFP subunit